jgi:hypothetical protein
MVGSGTGIGRASGIRCEKYLEAGDGDTKINKQGSKNLFKEGQLSTSDGGLADLPVLRWCRGKECKQVESCRGYLLGYLWCFGEIQFRGVVNLIL